MSLFSFQVESSREVPQNESTILISKIENGIQCFVCTKQKKHTEKKNRDPQVLVKKQLPRFNTRVSDSSPNSVTAAPEATNGLLSQWTRACAAAGKASGGSKN